MRTMGQSFQGIGVKLKQAVALALALRRLQRGLSSLLFLCFEVRLTTCPSCVLKQGRTSVPTQNRCCLEDVCASTEYCRSKSQWPPVQQYPNAVQSATVDYHFPHLCSMLISKCSELVQLQHVIAL